MYAGGLERGDENDEDSRDVVGGQAELDLGFLGNRERGVARADLTFQGQRR